MKIKKLFRMKIVNPTATRRSGNSTALVMFCTYLDKSFQSWKKNFH